MARLASEAFVAVACARHTLAMVIAGILARRRATISARPRLGAIVTRATIARACAGITRAVAGAVAWRAAVGRQETVRRAVAAARNARTFAAAVDAGAHVLAVARNNGESA